MLVKIRTRPVVPNHFSEEHKYSRSFVKGSPNRLNSRLKVGLLFKIRELLLNLNSSYSPISKRLRNTGIIVRNEYRLICVCYSDYVCYSDLPNVCSLKLACYRSPGTSQLEPSSTSTTKLPPDLIQQIALPFNRLIFTILSFLIQKYPLLPNEFV